MTVKNTKNSEKMAVKTSENVVESKVWIGLVDGRLSYYREPGYYRGVIHGDFYKTKQEALKCYEKVIRVSIKEIK